MTADIDQGRILVIGMANSAHTVSWINHARVACRVFVLSVTEPQPLESLRPWIRVRTTADVYRLERSEVGLVSLTDDQREAAASRERGWSYRREPSPAAPDTTAVSPEDIRTAVNLIQPDVVHSMETQMAGYLTLEARSRHGGSFPYWLHSNWGSDLFHFLKLPGHLAPLSMLAKLVDGYTAECRRDLALFRKLGFGGEAFGIIPNSGGLAPGLLESSERYQPPSARRTIALKGYHGWSGRANLGLAALALIEQDLEEFEIRVVNPDPPVHQMIERLRATSSLDLRVDPWVPHDEALKRRFDDRIAIGLSITDGISISLLESMGAGAFPIQSDMGCAQEWIENGVTGFVVSPHDTAALAEAIRTAVHDDAMVDQAARANHSVIQERWSSPGQRRRIRSIYGKILRVIARQRRQPSQPLPGDQAWKVLVAEQQRGAMDAERARLRKEVDDLRARLDACGSHRRKEDQAHQELAMELWQLASRLHGHLEGITQSRSWKMTSTLNGICHRIRHGSRLEPVEIPAIPTRPSQATDRGDGEPGCEKRDKQPGDG